MGFFRLLSLFLFFHGIAQAQNIQVVSHYPVTAYITERLLPFSIVPEEAGQEIRIQSVHLIKGESCRSIIDPFYIKIFHVYCEKPTQVQVEIMVNTRQGTPKISVDEFQVRGKNESESSSEYPGDGL